MEHFCSKRGKSKISVGSPADDKPLILVSERSTDQTKVEIKLRLVGEVQPTDYHYMQFFNIVLRQVGWVPSSLI